VKSEDMTDDTKSVVAIACRGLEVAVERLLERYEKKKQKTVPETVFQRAKTLVEHAHALFETLQDKRASLRSMLKWFRNEWTKAASVGHNESSSTVLEKHPLPVLQHFVQVFLRCQDGLVLLTSGECRHPGDIVEAKLNRARKRHFSQLHTLEKRNDGYTALYRSDAVYSGLSFDEFSNETVGIQARLTKLLAVCHSGNKDKTWEYLVGHGGQGVEALLDQHETDIKELQQQLQDMKQLILRDVKHRLQPQKISFVTHDKTERLVVVFPTNRHSLHEQKIVLERRGDSFQIQDPKGVLPRAHKSPRDWWRVMPLVLPRETTPTNQTNVFTEPRSPASGPSVLADRRRRRTIEDSDSENEEQSNVKKHKMSTRDDQAPTATRTAAKERIPATSGGLVVKVEIAKPRRETEESLAVIKVQMGASVEGLETAREELEQETTAGVSNSVGDDGIFDHDAEAIRRGKRKVHRILSILKLVQSRSEVDDNEVWDARECLREAYMSVGNDLLWSSGNTTQDIFKSSSSSRWQDALRYFELARDLVKEQQAGKAQLSEDKNDLSTVQSLFVQRNLLLLEGQACVNCGITLIECSQLEENKPASQRRYQERAVQELIAAQTHARAMRQQSQRDLNQVRLSPKADSVDCIVDILKADQLESLASRWMGVNLWHVRKQDDSLIAFDRATSFFSPHLQDTTLQNHPNILQTLLEVGAECVCGCSTLAELACTAIEKLEGGTTEHHGNGDKLLVIAEQFLEKQAVICRELENLKLRSPLVASAVQIFQEESEIPKEEDVRDSLRDIKGWWSQAKSQRLSNLDKISSSFDRSAGAPLPRSDLFGQSGQVAPNASRGPTRRFIVVDGSKRAKNREPCNVSATGSRCNRQNAVHALHFDDENIKRPKSFRKWGDELLPQVVVNEESGETGPKLAYPTLAPEMPPNIRAIFLGRN
jgi:hypothetical protein